MKDFDLKSGDVRTCDTTLRASSGDVRDGQYLVDFDHSGLIRARFVIPKTRKAWMYIDHFDEKVRQKFPDAELASIKRHIHRYNADSIQWIVKWTHPEARIHRTIDI